VKSIEIGLRVIEAKDEQIPVGRPLKLDVDVFLRTRMLVQAASGAGKSHWLRRLCEQLYGAVQIFIIDHEGEFATLRKDDAFDFVIAGEGGDTPLDLRSAGSLANRLLELNASTVFDLSEAFRKHPRDRHTWVKLFLNAMMEAPKRLWHPVVVVVDEAHKFAPEKGESEALDSMIALATDGRKRQFCAVFATQRLGKLSKDAAAELLNVMIGGTVLDLDRKRAADALGVYGPELRPFNDQIKTIERGNFWSLGPAIANERTLVHVGPTATQPPRPGSASAAPPPPTSRIKAMLPKLEDLPKEAATKAQTEADLQKRIRALEQELRQASKVQPATAQPAAVRSKITIDYLRQAIEPIMAMADARWSPELLDRFRNRLVAVINEPQKTPKINWKPALREAAGVLNRSAGSDPKQPSSSIADIAGSRKAVTRAHPVPSSRPKADIAASNGELGDDLSKPQIKILRSLTELEQVGQVKPTRAAVAFWSAQSVTSSAFEKNLSRLRTEGYVQYPDQGHVALDDLGRHVMPAVEPPSTEDVYRRGLSILSAPQQKLFQQIYEAYPEELSRPELAERAEVQFTSSAFEKNVSALRTAGLIDYPSPRVVKASAWLFLED
jgi:hypothetical protein